MKVDVLLGLQWGDEGKGKIVDVLTPKYDVIARFQGGPNAGHTIEFDGMKFVLHTIPSGIFNPKKQNLIGNGVIIDPYVFKKEVEQLAGKNLDATQNLLISRKAHLILPSHRLLDAVYEQSKGKLKIGSTLKGIGPTYTDKVARLGIRVGDLKHEHFAEKYAALKANHQRIMQSYNVPGNDIRIERMDFETYEKLWFAALETLKQFELTDSEHYINSCLESGKKVLAEGAQGSLLDIDFGSYPFVTSSNTISAGVCSGLGIAPAKVGKVFGVFKAYCTRVGSGPFPTELFDEDGKLMREQGHEFGSTTGRPRRCGWLDMPALKYTIMLSGVTDLIMTKGDVLSDFETIRIATQYQHQDKTIDYMPYDDSNLKPAYHDLKGWKTDITKITSESEFPKALNDYIRFIETASKTPISIVSVGPDRKQTILR